MDDIQTFTLPAGTVVYRNGIPMRLVADTQIKTHFKNWPLICEGFVVVLDDNNVIDGSREGIKREITAEVLARAVDAAGGFATLGALNNNSGKQD